MAGVQGRLVGGYQLAELVGSGSIAEVYRGRGQAGGRDVVVKVIYPEFARQPGFTENFQRIVQMGARLARHPHILPLLASGEESGYAYLVMPYVTQGSVRDWLARGGRLGPTDVAPFFRQLCGALAYAHSLGLAHGNLKPSNIFLYEGRHLLLGDFGLLWDVRQLDMDHSGSGTEAVAYLAPEEFSGESTQASDIYSLGAVLFATITGHPPFSGPKPADLLAAHAQRPAPHLTDAEPTLAPPITLLDAVIQRAMAKAPQGRYASASAAMQAIEATIGGGSPPSGALAHGWSGAAQPTESSPFAASPPVAGWSGGTAPFGASGPATGWPGGAAPAPFSAGLALPRVEPPFPPLEGSLQADEAMETGNIKPQSSLMQEQTERVPAWQVAGPAAAMSGHLADPAARSLPTERVPTPPGAHLGELPGGVSGARATDTAAAGGWPRLDEPDLSAFAAQKLPAVRPGPPAPPRDAAGAAVPPARERASQSGSFSATELGLPRLTVPELPNLPHTWDAGLSLDMPAPTEEWMGAPDGDAREASRAYDGAPDGAWDGQDGASDARDRHGARGARDARDARDERDDRDDRDGEMRAAHPARVRRGSPPTEESGAWPAASADDDGAWPDARGGEYARHGDHPSAWEDSRESPSFAEQRVWTRGTIATRARRRRQRRRAGRVLLLVLLLLAGGAAVVYARPSVCPTALCLRASVVMHRYLPSIGGWGALDPTSLDASPAALTLRAAQNATAKASVTLSYTGPRAAAWSASGSLPWLASSPATGSIAPGGHQVIAISVTPQGVRVGVYHASVSFVAGSQTVTLPVTVTVTAGPQLTASPGALTFTACDVPRTIALKDSGGAALSFRATSSSATALSVTPTSGTLAAGAATTLSATISCAAPTGQDYAIILVSNGGSTQVAVQYA